MFSTQEWSGVKRARPQGRPRGPARNWSELTIVLIRRGIDLISFLLSYLFPFISRGGDRGQFCVSSRFFQIFAYPDVQPHPDTRTFDTIYFIICAQDLRTGRSCALFVTGHNPARLCPCHVQSHIQQLNLLPVPEVPFLPDASDGFYLMVKEPIYVFAAGMGTVQKTPLRLRLVTMRT